MLTRILRNKLIVPAVMMLTVANLNGCFSETSTGPENSTAEAPVLPPVEALTFNFDFFDQGQTMARAAGKDTFVDAYLRVVVVSALVDLMLTPPVYAFSLALNTPPSLQDDGSWIWVYTYVNGAEEAQIRLRGEFLSEHVVAWEMRVSASGGPGPQFDNALWFRGQTNALGDSGYFVFHDAENDDTLEAARIDWGRDTDGNFLRLTDLNDNVGDSLEYRELANDKTMSFTDVSDPSETWVVNWDEATGAGSLTVGGEQSCWDERQYDTECGVPAL